LVDTQLPKSLVELAQRRLEAHQPAELQRYVATQFRRGASDEPVEGLAECLETRRVVLQLGGANLGDVLDVACALLAVGPAGRRRRSCRRRSASGGRRLRWWSVRASRCRTCRWPALRWRRRW